LRDGSALTDSAAEAGPGLPSATDYADVVIEQDFTQPVWLPPPRTTFQGDAASLVGVWVNLYDQPPFGHGGICDPLAPDPFWGRTWSECFQIEIQQDASGAFHGTLRLEVSPNVDSGIELQGPFAPATDPNVGYPTTVNPSEYLSAEDGCSNVGYRLFDPVFAGGKFSFWFSPYDLWTDWCALQTPFAWYVRGETKYACVPQTADSSTTPLPSARPHVQRGTR
jgi:hypothetical protein